MRPYSYQRANQINLRELLGLGVPSVGPFVGVSFWILRLTTCYWTPTLWPPGYLKKTQPFAGLGLLLISNFGIFFENEKKHGTSPGYEKRVVSPVFSHTGQLINSTQPDGGPPPVNNGGNPTWMSREVVGSKVSISG